MASGAAGSSGGTSTPSPNKLQRLPFPSRRTSPPKARITHIVLLTIPPLPDVPSLGHPCGHMSLVQEPDADPSSPPGSPVLPRDHRAKQSTVPSCGSMVQCDRPAAEQINVPRSKRTREAAGEA